MCIRDSSISKHFLDSFPQTLLPCSRRQGKYRAMGCRRALTFSQRYIHTYTQMLALELYRRDWKMIQKFVGTRSATQIRSHAQKYDLKQSKKSNGVAKRKRSEANVETKEDDVKTMEKLVNIKNYIEGIKLGIKEAKDLSDINKLINNLQIVVAQYIIINDSVKGSSVANSFEDISKSIEQCRELLNESLRQIKQDNTTCRYLYELM
eukprot:TRINITY_DN3301_c0_g2_i2.p1 TRINITY_DN3301_c0_g2~~TRINITY_DN3301_c0_g2_i2.p1  ORF type:complete len:207 (+),score=39.44 TRINITY_DN3301_c0_g2_i2:103-723(+)